MGFPSQVNVVQAPAIAGDFASSNPRFTVLNGPGDLVAGPNGLTMGLFAWGSPAGFDQTSGETDAFSYANNFGPNAPTGFVARHFGDALTTTFLANSSLLINPGLEVTLYSGGDFWVKNSGTTAATAGMKAYANNATGAISFAATGSPTSGGTSTASTLALNTSTSYSIVPNSVTGSISGTTLTVTAVGTGGVAIGQTLSGANVNVTTTVTGFVSGTYGGVGVYTVSVSQTAASGTIVPSGGMLTVAATITGTFAVGQTLSGTGVTTGTTITAPITGTGGAGTYAVSISQSASTGTITASGGTLTVGGTLVGTFAVGDTLYGASVTAGTYITALGTGTGGAGTYLLNQGQTLTSQAINVYGNTETKWYCMSAGAAGELVKMTDHAIG